MCRQSELHQTLNSNASVAKCAGTLNACTMNYASGRALQCDSHHCQCYLRDERAILAVAHPVQSGTFRPSLYSGTVAQRGKHHVCYRKSVTLNHFCPCRATVHLCHLATDQRRYARGCFANIRTERMPFDGTSMPQLCCTRKCHSRHV